MSSLLIISLLETGILLAKLDSLSTADSDNFGTNYKVTDIMIDQREPELTLNIHEMTIPLTHNEHNKEVNDKR